MPSYLARALCVPAVLWTGAAAAQDADVATAEGPLAGIEIFASTDSDNTDVLKVLAKGALWDGGPDKYLGVAVEKAWFSPQGQDSRKEERVYIDAADGAGDQWFDESQFESYRKLGSHIVDSICSNAAKDNPFGSGDKGLDAFFAQAIVRSS